jgi:hypothetical protein
MLDRDSSRAAFMQYAFPAVFASDDADEWRDGIVDDNERMVLGSIVARVSPQTPPPEVRDWISRFTAERGIP